MDFTGGACHVPAIAPSFNSPHGVFIEFLHPKLEVSKNRGGPPKSSILIGVCHYFHHPFWGAPIFGNTQMVPYSPKNHLVQSWDQKKSKCLSGWSSHKKFRDSTHKFWRLQLAPNRTWQATVDVLMTRTWRSSKHVNKIEKPVTHLKTTLGKINFFLETIFQFPPRAHNGVCQLKLQKFYKSLGKVYDAWKDGPSSLPWQTRGDPSRFFFPRFFLQHFGASSLVSSWLLFLHNISMYIQSLHSLAVMCGFFSTKTKWTVSRCKKPNKNCLLCVPKASSPNRTLKAVLFSLLNQLFQCLQLQMALLHTTVEMVASTNFEDIFPKETESDHQDDTGTYIFRNFWPYKYIIYLRVDFFYWVGGTSHSVTRIITDPRIHYPDSLDSGMILITTNLRLV